MVGDWSVFRETYFQCLQLLEFVHDSVDMNLVMPLILLAANAFFIFPAEKGITAAISFLLIGEAICLAKGETRTEVSRPIIFPSPPFSHNLIN